MSNFNVEVAGCVLKVRVTTKGDRYVSLTSLSKITGVESGSLRNVINQVKMLRMEQGLQGIQATQGLLSDKVDMIDLAEFCLVTSWLAKEGNQNAQALMTACFYEILNRRIDGGLK